MWHPSKVTALTAEPVTLNEAKVATSVDDSDHDAILGRLVSAARAHAEAYCGQRFAAQIIVAQCDGFTDLARVPEAPLSSVTSIGYVDEAGDAQTLSAGVFEARIDGLEPSIVLKPGQAWPMIRPGSRITLTAAYGGSTPEDVRHGILLFVAGAFENRETGPREPWTTLDALLCNHRRYA